MSQPAIIVENLSKKFRIGTSGGPGYHRLSEMLTGLPRYAYSKLRPPRPELREPTALAAGSSQPTANRQPPTAPQSPDFWALKDVSFEVQPGDVVGIIGRNGAGKSTLLKILSRITEPTSGRFGVRGRVASLLEVGTGFHPELTGRENIYVSGITLGMTRSEVKKNFDEIVNFSGVNKFLDTPVKRYSSGMQVRLGFAVAAHLRSEILIVDEVLAVGDSEFQKKCIGKMQAVAGSGSTVLFVSHKMAAIAQLCSSCVLLDEGRCRSTGATENVLSEYRNLIATLDDSAQTSICVERSVALVSQITAVDLLCRDAPLAGGQIGTSDTLEIVIDVSFGDSGTGRCFAVLIHDLHGEVVLHIDSRDGSDPPMLTTSIGDFSYRCCIDGPFLREGHYSVSVQLMQSGSGVVHSMNQCVQFSVEENTSLVNSRRSAALLYPPWEQIHRNRDGSGVASGLASNANQDQ